LFGASKKWVSGRFWLHRPQILAPKSLSGLPQAGQFLGK
jgi:hypothetical protein